MKGLVSLIIYFVATDGIWDQQIPYVQQPLQPLPMATPVESHDTPSSISSDSHSNGAHHTSPDTHLFMHANDALRNTDMIFDNLWRLSSLDGYTKAAGQCHFLNCKEGMRIMFNLKHHQSTRLWKYTTFMQFYEFLSAVAYIINIDNETEIFHKMANEINQMFTEKGVMPHNAVSLAMVLNTNFYSVSPNGIVQAVRDAGIIKDFSVYVVAANRLFQVSGANMEQADVALIKLLLSNDDKGIWKSLDLQKFRAFLEPLVGISRTPYRLYIAMTVYEDGTHGVINRCSQEGNKGMVQTQVPLLLMCFDRCVELKQHQDAISIRQNMRSLQGYRDSIEYMDKVLREYLDIVLED